MFIGTPGAGVCGGDRTTVFDIAISLRTPGERRRDLTPEATNVPGAGRQIAAFRACYPSAGVWPGVRSPYVVSGETIRGHPRRVEAAGASQGELPRRVRPASSTSAATSPARRGR